MKVACPLFFYTPLVCKQSTIYMYMYPCPVFNDTWYRPPSPPPKKRNENYENMQATAMPRAEKPCFWCFLVPIAGIYKQLRLHYEFRKLNREQVTPLRMHKAPRNAYEYKKKNLWKFFSTSVNIPVMLPPGPV